MNGSRQAKDFSIQEFKKIRLQNRSACPFLIDRYDYLYICRAPVLLHMEFKGKTQAWNTTET